MTSARTVTRRLASLSRRRLLLGAGAAAGVGAVAGAGIREALGAGKAANVPLGPQPAGLPARQHAWDAYLAADADGNPIAPKFDRLLFFDVNGDPSPAHARLLEAALRTLERDYRWLHSGLLFTAAWGPGYFSNVLGVSSPVPPATALSGFEQPVIDDYHLCLHLASDDESRLTAIEAALTRSTPLPSAKANGQLDVSSVLRWRQSRTGFAGTGLPAERQDVNGIPDGQPVPGSSPLFMGFKSGLRRNQASEDDVTIPDGPFAGGTTMHVSYLRLRLGTWYGQLSQRERVARMYAPQVTPEQVRVAFRVGGELAHLLRRDLRRVHAGHAFPLRQLPVPGAEPQPHVADVHGRAARERAVGDRHVVLAGLVAAQAGLEPHEER